MNHLAHILLGEAGGCSATASLLGDFVKGRPEGLYGGDLLAGIRLHRRLDTWVDRHPAHLRARRRLAGPWRRYAGVLVDIYFDHLLARAWERYHPVPLAEHAERVYAELETRAPLLPQRLVAFSRYARREALLTGYGDLDRIAAVLRATGQRLRRPVFLHDALPVLERDRDHHARDLAALLPEALGVARAARACRHGAAAIA